MTMGRHLEADGETILGFQNLLIRLFSLIHAAALCDIESGGGTDIDPKSFDLELIDAESIDAKSIRAIGESNAKVELIFQWPHQMAFHGGLFLQNTLLSFVFVGSCC